MVAPERWWRSSAAEIGGLVMDPVCPPVGARGRVASLRPVAELHFFTGTMDSGKSTIALQTNHNQAARGRIGSIFTTHERAGEATRSEEHTSELQSLMSISYALFCLTQN